MYARQFRSVCETTSIFQTKQYLLALSTQFLCLVDSKISETQAQGLSIELSPQDLMLYASTRVTFHFILRHSCHLFVLPVMSPSFPSLLRHRRLFILLTVPYRLLSSLRPPSFVYSFVTDLFRPFYAPSIIPRICGYAIIL